MTNNIHTRLYRAIVNSLEKSPLPRERLISEALKIIGINSDVNLSSIDNSSLTRGRIGTIINEMHSTGLIGMDEAGKYYLVYSKPVIIRVERCEKEILLAITDGPKTKAEIRDHLKRIFGTDKTATTKDDDLLYTYMGHILKRLVALGAITNRHNGFTLSEKATANADNINQMLSLRDDFLLRLHSKGGEFFEHYFVELISKYLAKNGKKIASAAVTAGSDDGGIDGIVKTEDCLGFRETIMIQTKNRLIITNETDIRGFYGAVCAKKGTRGIYAITSKFHHNARKFLDSLDDCIGIDGDDVFDMAVKCKHGITRYKEKYVIDNKIFD
jgi:hypothetical protein